MRKILALVLLFQCSTVFSQEKFSKEIKTISDIIVEQITSVSAKAKLGKDTSNFKIAIIGIDNEDKKYTKLTELIENKLSINLAMKASNSYTVLDRNYIEKLMLEKNIPLKYDNKRDFAKDLGRIKAANFVIVGTLSNFENDYELNLQLIETREGNTFGGASGTITATQLLKEKNGQTDPPAVIKSMPNPREQTEPVPKATTGTIEIQNKLGGSITILIGTETVEPANFGKKYEETSIAANSTEKIEGMAPGIYYVCATFGRQDFRGCFYSKRVVVEAGKKVLVGVIK